MGEYNVKNVIMVIVVVCYVGIVVLVSIVGLVEFIFFKCCMEFKVDINLIKVYDDFVYYLMVIKIILVGFCVKVGDEKIIVILEFCLNIMKMGVY